MVGTVAVFAEMATFKKAGPGLVAVELKPAIVAAIFDKFGAVTKPVIVAAWLRFILQIAVAEVPDPRVSTVIMMVKTPLSRAPVPANTPVAIAVVSPAKVFAVPYRTAKDIDVPAAVLSIGITHRNVVPTCNPFGGKMMVVPLMNPVAPVVKACEAVEMLWVPNGTVPL